MKKSPKISADRFVASTFPRIALCLTVMSATLWYTSWPIFSLGPDVPNCIAARWDDSVFAIGFLSHDRVSCLFLTTEELEPDREIWSEITDGHYCGFPIPLYGQFIHPPTKIAASFSLGEIVWICPYWSMTTLWVIVALKGRKGLRFGLADVFAVATCLAILFAAIHLKVALLLAAPLNLLTAIMFALLALRAICILIKDGNPLWPFVVSTTSKAGSTAHG